MPFHPCFRRLTRLSIARCCCCQLAFAKALAIGRLGKYNRSVKQSDTKKPERLRKSWMRSLRSCSIWSGTLTVWRIVFIYQFLLPPLAFVKKIGLYRLQHRTVRKGFSLRPASAYPTCPRGVLAWPRVVLVPNQCRQFSLL